MSVVSFALALPLVLLFVAMLTYLLARAFLRAVTLALHLSEGLALLCSHRRLFLCGRLQIEAPLPVA